MKDKRITQAITIVNQDDRIKKLEGALRKILCTRPEGDTAYKYGYAWESALGIANDALKESKS